MTTTKKCGKCKKLKSLNDFYTNQGYCKPCGKSVHDAWVLANSETVKAQTKNRYTTNKEEMKLAAKQWRKENPERVKATAAAWYEKNTERSKAIARRATLNKKYGLSPEEYEKLLRSQNGVCAICGKAPNGIRLSIDHDHGTKKIRGLLCSNHNTAIGLCHDSPEELLACATYLERAGKNALRAVSP